LRADLRSDIHSLRADVASDLLTLEKQVNDQFVALRRSRGGASLDCGRARHPLFRARERVRRIEQRLDMRPAEPH